MAIITRRYRFVGPSDAELANLIGASAERAASFPISLVDISFDDSVDGIIAQADEYMESVGWTHTGAVAPAVLVASSKLGYELVTVITEAGPAWQLIDGVITSPDFVTPDLNSVSGRIVGEFRTTGAGAELQVVEAKTGFADVVMGSAVFPDTGGVWTKFGFSTTVPPRNGQNEYTLLGRTNGVVTFELRFATLSLLKALQV